MLNQCIIQGIVELGVANLKKKINISCQAPKSDRQMGRKHKFDFFKKRNLEFGNTPHFLLLLKCRSMSDVRGWSLELGLPYLYLIQIVKNMINLTRLQL